MKQAAQKTESATHGKACCGNKTSQPVQVLEQVQQQAGNQAVQGMFVQTKLSVSRPDDPFEKEADRVADEVMRKPEGSGNPPSISAVGNSLQRQCADCINEEGANLAAVQRKPAKTSNSRPANPARDARLPSCGGKPLGHETRRFFEPRFVRDLSNVRVHADASSDQMVRAYRAKAFTSGRHIVFASGEYQPGSLAGKKLLAHELTHFLQQSGGRARRVIQRTPEDEAKALEALGSAGKEKDPEPGENTVTHYFLDGSSLLLSKNTSYLRRLMARQIGKLGLQRTETNVAEFELSAKAAGGRKKEIAPLLRQQYDKLAQEWKSFSANVRNVAIARLKRNRAALADWSTYVDSLAPRSFFNQTLAAQEYTFMESLAKSADPDTGLGPFVGPYDMKNLAEKRAWSDSPGYRGWVEALDKKLINSGCMDCHVQKAIPEIDARFPKDHPARIAPVYRLQNAALQEFRTGGSPEPNIMGQKVHGEKVSGEVRNYVQGMPGLTSIANSIDQIRPKVRILETQYKVIPEGVINSAITPSELVTTVLSWIESRRDGYKNLSEEISQEDYDFLQLLPIIDAFIATVDADVQIMIRDAQRQSAAAKQARQVAEGVLGVVAMLMIIFPPTAPLGLLLGVGLAGSGFARGFADYKQGQMYAAGTGAEIFSPEQEAAAGMLMAGGIMNMVLSTYSLAASGMAARGMFRTPSGVPKSAPSRHISGAEGKPNSAWRVVSHNPKTGDYTVVGKNLAPGSRGEMATVRVNIKTGRGSATLHGPNGGTVPIVDGKLQPMAGLLPPGGSVPASAGAGGGLVHMPAPASVAPSPPMLPGAGSMGAPRALLPAMAPGLATSASPSPHFGSRVILPSNAPAPGEAPVYTLPLGADGTQGSMLMNRGLRPTDFGNAGFVGGTLADDAQHLRLWLQAEKALATSPKDNIYKRWLIAVQDGSVANWSSSELHKVYAAMWDKYKVAARAEGIDVATLHHWNYNKSQYPNQIVDPRNLMPIYGQSRLAGGHHPAHQGGVHPLTSSGHPTRDPVSPVHELPLENYNVPRRNPDYPGMPHGWHPPMRDPTTEIPFGWNPFHPPEYDWPGGLVPLRPLD
ncbi:MAG: DUF4157 domain-containing protein [Wenzhouxiangellaceae bacterium]